MSPKITKTMFSLGATPEKINPSIYKKVYEGVIPEQDLNEIFKPFEYPNDTYDYINKDQVLKLIKDIHGFCRNDVLNDLIIRINNLPTIVLPKKD